MDGQSNLHMCLCIILSLNNTSLDNHQASTISCQPLMRTSQCVMWNKHAPPVQTQDLKGTLYMWVNQGSHWKLLKIWKYSVNLLYLLYVHVTSKMPVAFWCVRFWHFIALWKNLWLSSHWQGNPKGPGTENWWWGEIPTATCLFQAYPGHYYFSCDIPIISLKVL